MAPKTIAFVILAGIAILVFGGITIAQVVSGAEVSPGALTGTILGIVAGLWGVIGAGTAPGKDIGDTDPRRNRGFIRLDFLGFVGLLGALVLLAIHSPLATALAATLLALVNGGLSGHWRDRFLQRFDLSVLAVSWLFVACTPQQLDRLKQTALTSASIVISEGGQGGLCALSCKLFDDRAACYEGCLSDALGDAKAAALAEVQDLVPDLLAAFQSNRLEVVASRPTGLLALSVPDPDCELRHAPAIGTTVTVCPR